MRDRRVRSGRGDRNIVLGVDPGTLTTGFGIVEQSPNGTLSLVAAGTIRNSGETPMQERLKRICDGLRDIITEYSPNEFAIESAFCGKNAQSALKLGQVRGASLVVAADFHLEAREYSPREVKLSVVGTGSASKQQVHYMVRAILQKPDLSLVLDASDAIAVALCHLHRSARDGKGKGSWKAFVAAHPERVVS